ncbi:Phosphorelay intermediate protein [Metarhizium acridum]|nr:Phosphorelay intermediate protein [Metarhizium acridum]
MSPTEDKTGADSSAELNFGDAIDMNTFEQILEMDDPGSDEFSSSIVFGFFTQAQENIRQYGHSSEMLYLSTTES